MLTPNCTLVTACFDLSKYHRGARSVEKSLEGLRILLKQPIYLVIFGNQHIIDRIQEERILYGYDKLTRYKVCEYEDIWSSQFTQKVKRNRRSYWPTEDERTCAESHLLVCNKFDFVLEVIDENPFQTARFGWIDSNLKTDEENNNKICTDYSMNKLTYVLDNTKTDKFHLQVMGCVDKKYKEKVHKPEYYLEYRWIVCGCLFICGADVGKKILTRLKQVFVETTIAGYGHGEEMFYLEVLDEFRDDIERAYGDYQHILNNFIHITKDLYYVYHAVLAPSFDMMYLDDVVDCGEKILHAIENHHLEIHGSIDYGLYISTMRLLVYSYHHLNPDRANEIHQHMVKLADTNDAFKEATCGYLV